MIQLRDVSKTFGSQVAALKGVTLHIRKGELVILTGPSGAGKTTLLRTIFAAERPDEGEILLAGRSISRLRRGSIPYLRRNIGVVFQDFKLLKERTALENVAVALEIRGLGGREVRRRSLEALAAVGLSDAAPTRVGVLSGGEQQRVAIARAVVGEPAIVLADEPTGNLDPERSHDILDLLDQIARRGTTVVLATHDPMVVEHAAATRVIQLAAGRVEGVLAGARAPVEVSRPRPALEPLGLAAFLEVAS
ncbi:MAG: cell division ATP-binding protein FtsE [Deltaproteobacteria bacterium]|nr:cell division ATP-binding protein FtsE [Deltaproteobacteria bacterium]